MLYMHNATHRIPCTHGYIGIPPFIGSSVTLKISIFRLSFILPIPSMDCLDRLAIPVIGGNGGLVLNSQPPGALIYINRYYQNQVTPARVGITDLGSDRTIEVSLKLMGYEIKTLKIELENEFDKKDIILEPIKSQFGDELNLPNQTIAKQQIQIFQNQV